MKHKQFLVRIVVVVLGLVALAYAGYAVFNSQRVTPAPVVVEPVRTAPSTPAAEVIPAVEPVASAATPSEPPGPETASVTAPRVTKSGAVLKTIRIQGVTVFEAAEIQQLTNRYIGMPMADVPSDHIVAAIETHYRRNNKIAQAMVVSKDGRTGQVVIDVMESVMPSVVTAVANGRMTPEPKSEQDFTPEPVAAVVVPVTPVMDAQADETDLLLSLYKHKSRQAELILDNAGAPATGIERVVASLSWFNPGAISDLLQVIAAHTRGSDYARVAYSLPFGQNGWRMGFNASVFKFDSLTTGQTLVNALGRAVTQGLEWVYPWRRDADHQAAVTLSADTKKFENTSSLGTLSSSYGSTSVAAQVAGVVREQNPGGGVGRYVVKLTQGNLDLTGSANEALDKKGPQTAGDFYKLKGSATWEQALSTKTTVALTYTAQAASRNLDSSEQMPIGGLDGVRAYATGVGMGTSAQVLQMEIRHTLDAGVSVAGFYDVGQTKQLQHANYYGAPANNMYTLKGFGTSLGYTTSDGIHIKASWARRHGSNPNDTVFGLDQQGSRDRNRYWLQATLPY